MTQGHRRGVEYDAIVVGAGLAGLTATALLARRGYQVMVLERRPHAGGRARSPSVNGVALNLGAHAFYRGGTAERILTSLGVPIQGISPNLSRTFVRTGGRLYPLPHDAGTILTSPLLTWQERFRLARALLAVRWAIAPPEPKQTWAQWCARYGESPGLQVMWDVVGRVVTYADDPGSVLAADVLVPLQQIISQGALYLRYGWQSLVDGLRRCLESYNARPATRASVHAVRGDGSSRLAGVQLHDGSMLFARAIVLAVPPNVAVQLLPDVPEAVRELRGFVSKCVPASVACLDLALRTLPQPEILAVYDHDHRLLLSIHPASWMPEPARWSVSTVAYLSEAEREDAALRRRRLADLEALLDAVQPGWRAQAVACRSLKCMDVTCALSLIQTPYARRIGPRISTAPAVFVAGEWTAGTGHLAERALSSAMLAADAASQALGTPLSHRPTLHAMDRLLVDIGRRRQSGTERTPVSATHSAHRGEAAFD
jgi:phytoene dehydrogenase-like protein